MGRVTSGLEVGMMLDWECFVSHGHVTKEILVAVMIVMSFNASYAIPERRLSIHLQESSNITNS